ncbi:MAG: DNA mismatch repair protein MutS [Halanaerobiales bacterium]
MAKLTPMMQQYHKIKENYPDSILFFRMGDFYEMFEDDAKLAAKNLDIALTSRNKGAGEKTPMAGVPAHSAEAYIAELIDLDYSVAICEQLEDPSQASGLVKRDVIRVITPGTIIENEILDSSENNFLTSVVKFEEKIGISYVDISTGDFFITEIDTNKKEKVWDEIDRIKPREVIFDKTLEKSPKYDYLANKLDFVVKNKEKMSYQKAYKNLINHFNTQSLSGFGCDDYRAGVIAAGQVMNFLRDTQKRTIFHINKLRRYNIDDYMVLDYSTRRNLELTTTIRENKKEGSLLSIIDKTTTAMGSRLIKRWINQPLIEKDRINQRLNAVDELSDNYMKMQEIQENLEEIYDLERILSKITYETANARDLAFLRTSLNKLPDIKESIVGFEASYLNDLHQNFDTLTDLHELIKQSIVDEPPVTVREGNLIKEGYNEELDELRALRDEGKDWITNLQKEERKRTGISSLKVGFNKVFGYYIEVTNPNLDKVPDDYQRKQTLSNSERYITPELKEKEAKVLGAEEKINDLEYELFVEVRNEISENIKRIKETATIISKIDVILSLGIVAIENNYCKPEINNSNNIEIINGRHPVVEKMVTNNFVPNDTFLDNEENRFLIITGPNMSGKSTYMRQVALIILLAQMGSFIPAKRASIGLVDRIFTRVGASDDLTTGQSTFMVEMNEVSNIVNNATDKSLIILDEVGRGTSTYDGVSIAWAVTEYINDPAKIGARTLFATHYHELTELEDKHEGIKNYNVLVEEDQKGVHFLYKIVPGQANQSYGIEVARLAGIPQEIIINAERLLKKLESKDNQEKMTYKKEREKAKEQKEQLELFKTRSELEKKLKDFDILDVTPIEAMNFLYEIKKDIKEED